MDNNADDLSCLMARDPFIAKFGETLDMTALSIDEQLRKRRINGLVDSGAVVELKTRPNQQRFKVLIHVPKYARWLTDPDGAVRAERERIKAQRRIAESRQTA